MDAEGTYSMNSTLQWNPRSRNADGSFRTARLEGSYMGVELVAGVAYQFDCGGGPYGRSLTPDVFTGVWTGVVDVDREPTFRHVDDRSIVRCPRTASWFVRLDGRCKDWQ